MKRWYGSHIQPPYRPYDIIKYTGQAGYSSEVMYPGVKSVDRSTYFDDEDAKNYPIKYNDNSCESWLKFRFKENWEGYTAFKDVKLCVSSDDPNIVLNFGIVQEFDRPTVSASTVAVIPQSACAYSSYSLTVNGISGITYGTSGEILSDYIVLQAKAYGTDFSYNGTPIYVFATYTPLGTYMPTDMVIEPAGFTPLGTYVPTDMVIEPAGFGLSTDMMIEDAI